MDNRRRKSLRVAAMLGGAAVASSLACGASTTDSTTAPEAVDEPPAEGHEAPDPGDQDAGVVVEWNELVMATAVEIDEFRGPLGHRTMALMHLAVHDALNAIVPVYEQHTYRESSAEAHPVAAASQAAHDVAVRAYPDHTQRFADLHDRLLAEVADGEAKQRGVELGAAAATAILDSREDDRFDSVAEYEPSDQPGAYRITPPHDAPPPVLVGWGDTEPLGMRSPDQFRPGPPPALDSETYAEELDEVKRLGRRDSEHRSEEQTVTGYWWAEYPTRSFPGFFRARVEEDDIPLWQAARVFALLAMDNFDALVSVFDAKWEYAYWRPITAIRHAAEDGNPATEADPDWEPEMTTPPHPDYPAALSTLCGGGAEVLVEAFGTRDLAFTRTSTTVPEGREATRSYDSVDEAVESCVMSRIYNGFHFRAGLDVGVEMGRERARYLLDNHLTRLPEADHP